MNATDVVAMPKTLGSYRIPESNLGALTAKLDKLARRSAKLGLPQITYDIGAPFDVPFETRLNRTEARIELKGADRIAEAKANGRLVFLRFVTLTLSGSTPRLAGWEFVATLQHLTDDTGTGINLLRSVPSFKTSLPVEYRKATPENCDHCHKRIKTRKETFIVRHEDGRWMQVGRRCTQDFLGGLDPHAVAAQLGHILSACSSCEESEGMGGGGGEVRVPIEQFLTIAAALIRVDGWTSRGRAKLDESLCATADSIHSMLNPPSRDPALSEWRRWSAERKPTPADVEVAEKALAHARDVLGGREDLNDYEHNLYVATCQDSIGPKLVGITASLIAYYLKEMERLVLSESRKKSSADSEHFGTIGKREEFFVTCSKLITNEGNWGTTYIHALVTREGNLATWFASSNPEMKIGTEYRVKATVKAHGEYRGAKQTTLTRLQVLPNPVVFTSDDCDCAAPVPSVLLGGPCQTCRKPLPVKKHESVAIATSDELSERRRAAAQKAVATRRANLAAKGVART